ncbi:MAG: beta-galactosidase [Planctomycetia bacterium]|nr:beta-galactosidase [Planctomycetia bacterium]
MRFQKLFPLVRRTFLFLFAISAAFPIYAQMIDNTHDRVQTTLDPGFERIGTIMPRTAKEVGRSDFAIGCEMLPRDYGDFEEFKEYIAPLGIKRIRLHAGWAKIEPEKGKFDFTWLDKQVDYLISQGMDPLLETSYGNPIYPGGGGASLSDGMPQGKEALAAWDHYVDKLAAHYKGRVRDWACWNEPNNIKINTPALVADNNMRTAEIIKKHIPDARIAALVLSYTNAKFTDEYLKVVSEAGKLGLFEWIIYHDYSLNPDSIYPKVENFVKIVRKYSPTLKIWQGESGATSDPHYTAPISSAKWNTELTQCKWNARRMLGDLGHDVESLIFTFYDPAYHDPERYTKKVDPLWIRTRSDRFMKRMGLVKCNEDFKVLKVKPAYYTVQNIASVFDSSIERIKNPEASLVCEKKTVLYVFRQKKTKDNLVVFWDSSSHPDNDNATVPGQLTLKGISFKEPVWVDTVSGAIYAIPKDRILRSGDSIAFKDIPLYDAPVFIAEKAMLIKGPYTPTPYSFQK